MKKLTKAQRHNVYTEALKLFLVKCNYGNNIGLCDVLSNALDKLKYNQAFCVPYDPFECPEDFPEIIKHKPETALIVFWWDIEDTEVRIRVLKQAIQETTPKRK